MGGGGGGERYRQIKKKRGGRMSETLKRQTGTQRERDLFNDTRPWASLYPPSPWGILPHGNFWVPWPSKYTVQVVCKWAVAVCVCGAGSNKWPEQGGGEREKSVHWHCLTIHSQNTVSLSSHSSRFSSRALSCSNNDNTCHRTHNSRKQPTDQSVCPLKD